MDAIDRIRLVIDAKSMSLKDFSDRIGIPYRTVQRYMARDRSASAEFLHQVVAQMDVSGTWLLTGNGNMTTQEGPLGHVQMDIGHDHVEPEFVHVPRLSVEASAGHGATALDEETTGFYAFNRKWLARRRLSPSNLAVVSVRGDSMEPRLSDGDLILVDRAQREIADGLAYVLRMDNDLLVKNVQRIRTGVVALLSANTFYPAREVALADIDGQLEVIGRVVASMHEW